MDACTDTGGLTGLGGGAGGVNKNTPTPLPPSLYRTPASDEVPFPMVCFVFFLADERLEPAPNPPPRRRSSSGSRAGGVLAAGRRGHEYSK